MKLLIVILMFVASINSATATVLEGSASKSVEASTRMTPFISLNFGGQIVKLGQQLFPSFDGCSFFCLGKKIYVYEDDTLLGIIDEDFGFHSADQVLVQWIVPRPDFHFAANADEVKYICSRVFCASESTK